MAIKPCSECSREISTDANPCPHCGKKHPHGKPAPVGKAILGGVLGLALLGWLASAGGVGRTSTPAPAPTPTSDEMPEWLKKPKPQPPVDRSPAFTIESSRLARDYDDNEVAADNLYRGKYLRVVGEVLSISKSIGDAMVVHLRGKDRYDMGPGAFMQKSEAAAVAKLRKGITVALICQCRGATMRTPSLHDCTIAE